MDGSILGYGSNDTGLGTWPAEYRETRWQLSSIQSWPRSLKFGKGHELQNTELGREDVAVELQLLSKTGSVKSSLLNDF